MSAAIDPARLEMIRAGVELTSNMTEPPAVYQDRADLLAHVDWLNERLVQAELAIRQTGIDAAAQHGADMSACAACVLYFPTMQEREEFVRVMQEAKPNMVSRPVR
jgi:hypothetical protein